MGGNSSKLGYRVEDPIFSMICIKDKVILSCGGGGKDYGIENHLIVYQRKIPLHLLDKSNIIFDLDTKDNLLEKLTYNPKSDLLAACGNEFCLIFHFDEEKGSIKELHRFKCDFKQNEPCLNECRFNYDGSMIATGGDDCAIRVWEISCENQVVKINKYSEFLNHTAPINALDFHVLGELFVSASEDKTCCLFNIKKKLLLRKFVFQTKYEENYKFFSCIFSLDEKNLFTVQNPWKGKSFLSVWDIHQQKETLKPIKTIELHGHPASGACLSKEGINIGIGFIDGAKKIVNLRHYDIEAEAKPHDMPVKGVCFSHDSRFLITGAVDGTYDFLPMGRPQGTFSKLSKLMVAIAFLFYIFLALKKNILGE